MPSIQLKPGKSISFSKLKAILEKVEELKEARIHYLEEKISFSILFCIINDLLEVYEDE